MDEGIYDDGYKDDEGLPSEPNRAERLFGKPVLLCDYIAMLVVELTMLSGGYTLRVGSPSVMKMVKELFTHAIDPIEGAAGIWEAIKMARQGK